jgi:integrase
MKRGVNAAPLPVPMRDPALVPMRGRVPEAQPFPPAGFDEGVSLAHQSLGTRSPFAFSSLGALDDAVTRASEQARSVYGRSEGTLVWTRTAYRNFRTFLAGTRLEHDFLSGIFDRQRRVLNAWIAANRIAGRDRVTINGYWRALRLLLSWTTDEMNMSNPLALLTSPTFERRQAPFLSQTDAERVLHWVDHAPWGSALARTRNLVLIGFMLLAGLRRGEVLRLQFGDVDLAQGIFFIRRGKGRNGGRDRTGYIAPQLRTLIERYLAERKRAGRTHPELLTSLRRNTGISATVPERLCRQITDGVGIHVFPHIFRHTFVTLCMLRGTPTRVIQQLSGHSTLQMVERYAHVVSSDAQDAIQKIILDIDVDGLPLPPS